MMAWLAFVTTATQLDYTLPRLAGRATLVGTHLSKLRGRTRNHLNQRREGHHDRGKQQLTALGLQSRTYESAIMSPHKPCRLSHVSDRPITLHPGYQYEQCGQPRARRTAATLRHPPLGLWHGAHRAYGPLILTAMAHVRPTYKEH